MIQVTISEYSKKFSVKKVCFSDSFGIFRIMYQDKNGIPILERLEEEASLRSVYSTVIFVGSEYRKVAFRNHIRDSENQRLTLEDYKLVGEEFILINKIVTELHDPNNPYEFKQSCYDGKGNLHYVSMDIEGESKRYDSEGREIDDSLGIKGLETIEYVESRYLEEVIKNSSNINFNR
ncbi:hypothetical protein KTH93_19620 [Acinetobacter bereziniae]|uniref:hypothetical protein n=1 Tax=Acinetobacter bereziniae TaxID=106648 RepID=UPI0021D0BC64|nr:hypothetical protein [Acinetobacter bereziniae]MCU4437665.1 hypothetical protein [Acinetobacter bereziniae]